MYARIKAAAARAEVERKGTRQSRAQQQRARQGRASKGVWPLGYRTSGGVIPGAAEVVKVIYAAFLRGDSLNAITRALSGSEGGDVALGVPRLPLHSCMLVLVRNARQVAEGKPPRPMSEDGDWQAFTVLGILRNPRHAGCSVYTKKADHKALAGGSRRKALKDNVVRDENGEPVLGQWEALVEPDRW